jgi:hypothetical protein
MNSGRVLVKKAIVSRVIHGDCHLLWKGAPAAFNQIDDEYQPPTNAA